MNEYEITPDGFVRKGGWVVDMPAAADPQAGFELLQATNDADAEAAKAFMRLEQTPVQTVGVPGLTL